MTYQNLPKSRVPINSILGFITRTYKKVGFGRSKVHFKVDSSFNGFGLEVFGKPRTRLTGSEEHLKKPGFKVQALGLRFRV